jgi:RNA polymerase sigma-70 factor (ECF subfamily)
MKVMHNDEQQLIEAARKGDFQAATELVERYYKPIYAFLRRLSGNETDAADLTQKTFDRIWPSLAKFAGRSSVSSWIHGIACHVYQDWRRSNRRTETRPDEWWADCRDGQASPDALAESADLNAALFAAVNRLEPDLRGAVHLHYFQGLNLEETASALEIAPRTVKYWLREALEKLQAVLDDRPGVPQLHTITSNMNPKL